MGVLQCHLFVGSVGQERCASCRTKFIGQIQEERLCLRMEEKKRRVNIKDVFKQMNAVNRENYAKTVEF
eukprot:XP_003242272.1 PREDICTED: uncharacterized protein LOC100572116 isoform X5 [Acyrthosiphon pisum]